VGELGWELYIPTMFTAPVFDAIAEAGEKMGMKYVGMQAVNSLRLETGCRHWESDITPDETPFEAGLGFGVKLHKGDFCGRNALLRQKEHGLCRKMVMFTLKDAAPMLHAGEPIFRNGQLAGEITSGAYGYKVGAAVGMGYVKHPEGIIDDDWIISGEYEIEVEGDRIAASASLKSPYDPQNKRVKM
jgi:4-methylaminobutanoate oxidase (formaldehyde-forming)